MALRFDPPTLTLRLADKGESLARRCFDRVVINVILFDIYMNQPYGYMMKRRTTIILEDGCMEGVREVARAENRTLSEVINELLVEGIQRRRQRGRRPPFKLPSFRMGNPRVNLGDRNALEALMDS